MSDLPPPAYTPTSPPPGHAVLQAPIESAPQTAASGPPAPPGGGLSNGRTGSTGTGIPLISGTAVGSLAQSLRARSLSSGGAAPPAERTPSSGPRALPANARTSLSPIRQNSHTSSIRSSSNLPSTSPFPPTGKNTSNPKIDSAYHTSTSIVLPVPPWFIGTGGGGSHERAEGNARREEEAVRLEDEREMRDQMERFAALEAGGMGVDNPHQATRDVPLNFNPTFANSWQSDQKPRVQPLPDQNSRGSGSRSRPERTYALGPSHFRVTHTTSIGPEFPPIDPNTGRGRVRFLHVKEKTGKVGGWIDCAKKVEGVVGIKITLYCRQTITNFYNGQPSLIQSNRLKKHVVHVLPTSSSSTTSNPHRVDRRFSEVSVSAKGKGKSAAVEMFTLQAGSKIPFEFEFPLYCDYKGDGEDDAEGERGGHGDEEEEDDDAEEEEEGETSGRVAFKSIFASGGNRGGSPTPSSPLSTSAAGLPSPPGGSTTRPRPILRTSMSRTAQSATTQSFSLPSSGAFSPPPPTAIRRSSTKFSETTNETASSPTSTSPITPTSPSSQSKPFGAFMRRLSSLGSGVKGKEREREGYDPFAVDIPSPNKGLTDLPPTYGSLPDRRASTSNPLGRCETYSTFDDEPGSRSGKGKRKYDLPPSMNAVFGDVQVEVNYEVKFSLKKKGWRLNDSVMFRLQYEPDPVIDIRPFTNIIAPDPSHFQTVHMTGGKAIVLGSPTSLLNRRRSSAGLTAGAGVHGDIMLPNPLVFITPMTSLDQGQLPLSIPFRVHLSSILPYPLLSFASPETADWSINLLREVAVNIHGRIIIRMSIIRGTFNIDETIGGDGLPTNQFGISPPNQDSHSGLLARVEQATSQDPTGPARGQRRSTSTSHDRHTDSPTSGEEDEPEMFSAEPEEDMTQGDLLADLPRAPTPPPDFTPRSEPIKSTLLLPPISHDAPPPIFGSPSSTSSPAEHVYVSGTYSLFRTAYRSVMPAVLTKEVSLRYWFEIEISPKPGAIKEAFEPIKVRVEASVINKRH